MSAKAQPRPGPDKRKSLVLGLVGLAVIVIIFVTVIPQMGSYREALTSLEAMTKGAVTAIGVSVVVSLAVYGLPFVAATPGLSYRRGHQLNQAASAIGNGVPGGAAFALGVKYTMLASYGVAGTASTAAIVSVGVWSIFVTLLFPILGVAAIELSGQAGIIYRWLAVAGLVTLVVGIATFGFVVRSESVARWIGRLGDRVFGVLGRRPGRRPAPDLTPRVVKFRADIADLVRRRWAAITGAQLAVSFTQFAVFYLAVRGVEGWDRPGTPLLVAFGSFAVAQVGLLIPITPGGLGTVDAAMIALTTALGVDPGQATAATLVWRVASFVPQIVVGVLELVIWSRRGARAAAAGKGRGP